MHLLEGIRVIDAGTRVAAPFCAGTLGESGAEVIKVEKPGSGEYLREVGPFLDDYSLLWAVEGRGRKSITLDLRKPAGQELFRRLTDHADVLCENFRPGTMEGWQLGPTELGRHLVYVRISVFGQDGPNRDIPGVDLVGLAYGGVLALTGLPDRSPVKSNVTVSDHLTGVYAAKAATAALFAREARGDGVGSVIDASLYGSVLRTLDWQFAAHELLGTTPIRHGSSDPVYAPAGVYRCGDDHYIAIGAGSEAQRASLARLVGDDTTVAAWASGQTARAAIDALLAARVPASLVRTAADIVADEARRDIGERSGGRHDLVEIDDVRLGARVQQAPHPRLHGRDVPSAVPASAPTVGQHNEEVWLQIVGLTSAELGRHIDAGLI